VKARVKATPAKKPQQPERRRRNRFRKTETKRAIRAMAESGLSVARVEIDSTGKVSIVAGVPTEQQRDELLTWMKDHADSTQGA
jgi:hypothetical protein